MGGTGWCWGVGGVLLGAGKTRPGLPAHLPVTAARSQRGGPTSAGLPPSSGGEEFRVTILAPTQLWQIPPPSQWMVAQSMWAFSRAQPYILPGEALEARRPGPCSQTPFGVLFIHPGEKGGGRSHLDTGRVPGEGTRVSLGQEGLLSRKCSHHWDRVLGYRVHVRWVGIGFSKSWWALTCPVGDPRRTWGEYPVCCWLMPPRW